MIYRIATDSDIPQIQVVRNLVHENRLSHPSLVTDAAVRDYINHRGRGWVCETDRQVTGFAIADLVDNNIWALFVHPSWERKGIGLQLQQLMLDWYFQHDKEMVWLSTAPGTRAEMFYEKTGWIRAGFHYQGEIRFEMNRANWFRSRNVQD